MMKIKTSTIQALEQLLTIEIDTKEIWGDVRDREIGRDVVLP